MDRVVRRDSNFELLRIVSMLFVLFHHLIYYSNFRIGQIFQFNDFILTAFESAGKLGVSLFVMITGYYKIKSKDVKISKLVGLELQVLFYSIGIFVLFMLFSNKSFILGDIPKIFLPNISKSYWFFSSYFILCLFIPYLNKLVNNIDKKEYMRLLIIGFIFLILIPSVVIYNSIISEGVYLYYYYLVGGYIRLYCNDIKGGIKYLIGFSILYLFIILMTMFLGRLSYSNDILLQYVWTYTKLRSILVFLSALCLFIFFKDLKLGNNKIINLVASTSFGVYLFHEHPFVRELLWGSLFTFDKLLNSNNIFITGIVIAILIYIIGFIIDLIRQVLFKYFTNVFTKVGWKKLFN